MAERSLRPVVHAAGGVLWRPAGSAGIEVALVHRPKYDDWSHPKGKLARAEHPLVGATREVAEETGFRTRAGRPLGEMRYPVALDSAVAEKVVRYWAMQLRTGCFQPNDEVDQLRWLAPADAVEQLTYDRDREPLRVLLARPWHTTTVLLIRHGRAGQRSAWLGPDRLRPLDASGQAQAAAVRAVGPCFAPELVLAADLTRCVDTVAPLAQALAVEVDTEATWEEKAHARCPQAASRRVRELAAPGRPVAICSQGGVIPDVVTELISSDGLELPAKVTARKGSMWALSFAADRLVDAEHFPSLAPPEP